MTLFRIVGLRDVWVNAEVPETQAAHVRSEPTPRFVSRRIRSRSARARYRHCFRRSMPQPARSARIDLANPGGELTPGMFVNVTLVAGRSRRKRAEEAVIATGKRRLVIVAGSGKTLSARGVVAATKAAATRDSQGLRGSGGGRVRPIPDRFGSEPQGGCRDSMAGGKPKRRRSTIAGTARSSDRQGRAHAFAWADSLAAMGSDDDGIQAARRRLAQGLQVGDAVDFEFRAEGGGYRSRASRRRPSGGQP